jgi:hypothetical protein
VKGHFTGLNRLVSAAQTLLVVDWRRPPRSGLRIYLGSFLVGRHREIELVSVDWPVPHAI